MSFHPTVEAEVVRNWDHRKLWRVPLVYSNAFQGYGLTTEYEEQKYSERYGYT